MDMTAYPDDAKSAFESSTLLGRFLVSRAHASRVAFRYCKKTDSPTFGSNPLTSQGYNKGNVIVYPQDSLTLSSVLPPSADHVKDTFCALFVGASEAPVRENIAGLRPCLVRKARVSSVIDFLLQNNPYYKKADDFAGFSQENLEAICSTAEGERTPDGVTPACIEIAHLDPMITTGESAPALPCRRQVCTITHRERSP